MIDVARRTHESVLTMGAVRSGAGRVVVFDQRRGLGAIEDDGGVAYSFHCTRVTDGSRSVPVGARVRYVIVPGALGRWEASGVEATSSG